MIKSEAYIRKASGQLVLFDREKLISSLLHSGANDEVAETITKTIELDLEQGMRTTKIYERAFKLLKMQNRPAASTYRLKRAVMELGPSGFPFEFLVAAIFQQKGYEVQTGVILQGKCVSHEVDVLAQNEKEVRFIECKFHNQPGVKSDVKAALYVHSRILDLKEQWVKDYPEDKRFIGGGLITNTKLTEDALSYSRCSGMLGLSWDSPINNSLLDKLREFQLLPITLLSSLSKREKQAILSDGLVLCRDISSKKEIFLKHGFEENHIQRINNEAQRLINEYRF